MAGLNPRARFALSDSSSDGAMRTKLLSVANAAMAEPTTKCTRAKGG